MILLWRNHTNCVDRRAYAQQYQKIPTGTEEKAVGTGGGNGGEGHDDQYVGERKQETER